MESNLQYFIRIDEERLDGVGDDQLQAIIAFLEAGPLIRCHGDCVKPVAESERIKPGLAEGKYYKVKLSSPQASGKQLHIYGKVVPHEEPNVCIIELNYKFLSGRLTHR